MQTLLDQAVAAHQKGDLAEAEKLYRALLRAEPRQADALALLGLLLGAKGEYREAIELTTRACEIDPRSSLFQLHRGTVLLSAKKLGEAAAAFRQAIMLQPSFPHAYYNLANALRADNKWDEAITAYRTAIAQKPDYAEACNNLALSLVHERQFDEAMMQAKHAVEVAPHYGEGWRTVCNIAEQVKEYELALKAGEKCIQLMPDSHYGWFGYGVALNRLDRNDEAVVSYKRALELQPGRPDIWDNLGQTYQSMGRLADAEAAFRKTIEVAGQAIEDEDKRDIAEEEYGNRHWHLALLQLLRGDLKAGFARYRSRFKDVGGLKRPANYSRPLWKGEDPAGKTILITDEQGFGDTLMFCRYLPLIKRRGARVVFSVHKVLEPLFTGWNGADDIITHGAKIPPYDYYASVFDLPHIFGTTLANVPADVPYLPLPAADAATLLPPDGRRKIGVVWGGSPAHLNDARRSIPLTVFSRLFDQEQHQFYSFNRDMKPGDADLLPRLPVTDLAPRLGNFADGARLIGQMDLIITCDTATAHLAGGMGKTVWVLLPFAPDWRWLTDRADNPWYPKARLFRQPAIGDWQSVIDAVGMTLKTMS